MKHWRIFLMSAVVIAAGAAFIYSCGGGGDNAVPIANDDTYFIMEGDTLDVSSPGVLGNDTDADSDSLTCTLETDVSHGTLSPNPDGSFTYTPDSGYSGTDSFTYRANDGVDNSNVATVTITINPNAPPVANNDNYFVAAGDTLNIPTPGVLGNDTDADSDPLTCLLEADVTNGTLSLGSDGSFIYTSSPGYIGTDSFTYRANDGIDDSNVATVTIRINAVPVANDDAYLVKEGGTLDVSSPGVLGNDTDADTDPLSCSLYTGVINGVLSLNSDGSFTYTPNAGFIGVDSFTYRASDGVDDSNIATVTITILDPDLIGTWMEIESEDPCGSTWDLSYTYETLKFNDNGTWEAEMCPSESWSGDAWYCDVPLEDTSGTWSSYGDTLSLNGSTGRYSIADTILILHDSEIWPCPGGDLPADVKYGWYEGCAGGALNNLLIGDYMSFVFTKRDEGGGSARYYDVAADGVGNATADAFQMQFDDFPDPGAQHLCYAVSSDRTMSIGPGTAGPIVTTHGIISGDGSLLALTDADGGPTMKDVDFGVHIAKSSMAGTAGIAGSFIVGQIEGEGWVSRIGVTIDTGAASGTWEILASENQGQVGGTGSLAFSFSSDSTFTVNVGGTVMEGIISPDRNVFAWGDTIWPRHMAVGVRMSSAGTPDGIGDYVINQMGTWAPATTNDSYVSRTDLAIGVSTFDYQGTAHSLGFLDSGTGIAYSVSADGTVRFPGNSGWVANLSPDGKVMVLVDADPATANDVHMGVAIKK